MWSFSQRNTSPLSSAPCSAAWAGRPTWITLSVHVCGTDSQKTGETEREDKVKKKNKAGRCTSTKQHAQTSPTPSRRGKEVREVVREGFKLKARAKEGSAGRHLQWQGLDHTLLWCCGCQTKAKVWWSSNSWRSFSTSTRCRCTTRSRARQACPTGNLTCVCWLSCRFSLDSKAYVYRLICCHGHPNSITAKRGGCCFCMLWVRHVLFRLVGWWVVGLCRYLFCHC